MSQPHSSQQAVHSGHTVGSGIATGQSSPARVRVAIVGPTASGKSEAALDLIEALAAAASTHRAPGAQVINADAFQFYRGMDIGTAKLLPHERRGIVHHQFDVLDVSEEASVAHYQRQARADALRIEAVGDRCVIVGGSGLYVRALTDDLDFPGTDPAVRARLEAALAQEGPRRLWERLREVDPLSSERIEASNTRRVVRALEVWELTGRPFSASLPDYTDYAPTVHLGLRPDRDGLNARIERRARAMFEGGLLDETRMLIERGLRQAPTAARAIGYSQALEVIDGGSTVEEAIASTALATRQLASRQIKWFRRDPRVTWLCPAMSPDGEVDQASWRQIIDDAVELVRRAEARLA